MCYNLTSLSSDISVIHRYPSSRSKLWKYFGFLADDSGQVMHVCDGTTIMSGSRYPTLSLMASLLHKLLEVTLKIADNNNYLSKCVKKSISNDLQSR